jgi:hypothetical protein
MKNPKELSQDQLTIMALELNVKMLTSQVELMERHMQKMDEVYYHIFPDRLAKDVKFGDQLIELLKYSPKPRKS